MGVQILPFRSNFLTFILSFVLVLTNAIKRFEIGIMSRTKVSKPSKFIFLFGTWIKLSELSQVAHQCTRLRSEISFLVSRKRTGKKYSEVSLTILFFDWSPPSVIWRLAP